MSALIDTIFPNSNYSKCLHLEINTGKKINSMTTVRDCETSQVIVACSDECKNELFSMVTLDIPQCTKCGTLIKMDDNHILNHNGFNYTMYVCEKCKGDVIFSLNDISKPTGCEECGKPTKMKCICLKVGYCSKECQIKKRPTHKLVCYKPT